jgi:hypothetical protein
VWYSLATLFSGKEDTEGEMIMEYPYLEAVLEILDGIWQTNGNRIEKGTEALIATLTEVKMTEDEITIAIELASDLRDMIHY